MSTIVLNESRDTVIPTIEVLAGGKTLPERFIVAGADVELTTETSDTGSARLKIHSAAGVSGEIDTKGLLSAFPLAGGLTVKLGYEGKNTTVFEGVIFESELSLRGFMLGELTVTALDKKALLRPGGAYVCHNVKSCSELLGNVASKYNMTVKAGKLPEYQNPVVFNQNGESDFDFLAGLAERLGCEFFVLGSDLYFRAEAEARNVVAKLGRGAIFSLDYRTSLSGLLAEAAVSAYDQDKGKSEQAVCKSPGYKTGKGNTASELFKKAGYTPAVSRSFYTSGSGAAYEPKALAEAMLQRNSMGLAALSLRTDGIPELTPGGLISLEDVAPGVDNTYYLKAVRHIYGDGTYRTELSCVSNTV